jgi:acyl-CoA synthetase (AMP-forming)/AMP-acid ligase II
MTIGTIVDAAVDHDPDRIALVIGNRAIGYGQLATAVKRCAAGLAANGVAAGSRVAVVDGGSLLSIASVLGAARIGAAAALMNPALTSAELRDMLRNARCVPVAVAGEPYAGQLRAAGATQVLTPTDLLRSQQLSAVPAVEDSPDREALVLFTSGTTGLPKAVGITSGQLSARIRGIGPAFRADAPPTVGMMCVPFFHVGGSLGLLAGLYSGNTWVVQERFDAGQWLRLVQEHRVRSVFLVPTMLQRILDHPNFTGTDLSSLMAIAYGAAAAPVALVRRAMAALPHVAFANVFGQTETLGAYTTLSPTDHRDRNRVGSVGTPLPGVKVRVVDPNTVSDVAIGDVGELWVDTSQNVSQGWLHTGDLARQDADGYIYPCGRLSDNINRGGEKFGPIEVEEALRAHPAITDAAVVGISDDEMGQRVAAAVVAYRPVTLEELRSHCRDRIAYFKLPERLMIVERIPYNETGKLNRRQLAALISAQR